MLPTSLAQRLRTALSAYNGDPIVFDGQSVRYVRAIVSAYNTMTQSAFSVFAYGSKAIVGTKEDCRLYMAGPPIDAPGLVELLQRALALAKTAPEAEPGQMLAGAEYLALAVEAFRGEGFGGCDMREALNGLITVNDDLV